MKLLVLANWQIYLSAQPHTDALIFAVVDCPPCIAWRAFGGAVHRTIRAVWGHAVGASARIFYKESHASMQQWSAFVWSARWKVCTYECISSWRGWLSTQCCRTGTLFYRPQDKPPPFPPRHSCTNNYLLWNHNTGEFTSCIAALWRA